MALQHCIKCGKLIGDTPSGFCETCKASDPSYTNLHKVKDYLYDNPNTPITAVSQATGVSITEITKFIRDGAIMEVSGVSVFKGDKCACGKPLEGSERICKDCKRENERAAERAKKELEKHAKTETPAKVKKAEFFTKHK